MPNNSGRNSGFYRVKRFGQWEVARWVGIAWMIHGSAERVDDNYWHEIDENEIHLPIASKRKPGHYWVATNYRWTIAVWHGKYWTNPGSEGQWTDDDYREIDEKEITRE